MRCAILGQLHTWKPSVHFPTANCAVLVLSRQSTQFTRITPVCRRPSTPCSPMKGLPKMYCGFCEWYGFWLWNIPVLQTAFLAIWARRPITFASFLQVQKYALITQQVLILYLTGNAYKFSLQKGLQSQKAAIIVSSYRMEGREIFI